VAVDPDVSGFTWTVADLGVLARLIAIVSLGQAQHAARIITALEPATPAFSDADLIADAKAQMQVRGGTDDERQASRMHRDGFLFECMSWIVARQSADERTFLKDPHIDATSHGLDGLILQLHPTDPKVRRATICEDKCTANPRRLFQRDVMRTFGEHHGNKRARDLVANAAAIIRESGLNGTDATKAAARVLNRSVRSYRAALTTGVLNEHRRARLFRGFTALDGIEPAQRIGATFEIDGDLRTWFQALADAVVAKLDALAQELDGTDV
jgi:hypothetical protein